MLVVHHLGLSQSERVVWLCEELGVPYELKRYARDPVTRLAPPEVKALHPIGAAPVINDGDLVMAESGAIVDYIDAKYGDGRLALKVEDPNFAEYLYWFHFANATLLPAMGMGMVAGRQEEGSPLRPWLQARMNNIMNLVETRLGNVTYFAGDAFTAADIVMVFPLTTMRLFAPLDLGPYPNIRAYLARIGERPAYREAMRKGDPEMTPMLA